MNKIVLLNKYICLIILCTFIFEKTAHAALTPWDEPLCTDLDYPTIDGLAAFWEDGFTPDFFPNIGHSCTFSPKGTGARCGDGICQETEGTDPTTCWEDCVHQYWWNNDTSSVEQITETFEDQKLNKIIWYGNSTARLFTESPETYIIGDGGYYSPNSGDDGGGTVDGGCGAQVLFVKRLKLPRLENPYDKNLYCVDKRFRGKTLRRLLAWVHSAILSPDGKTLVVTNTNDSIIYGLDINTLKPIWQMDGLHYDSITTGVEHCQGGPPLWKEYGDCCSAEGCSAPFTEGGDVTSGWMSYENMAYIVWDQTVMKHRLVVSNRSWTTLAMVDIGSDGKPEMLADNGKYYGNVSWSFGYYGDMAVSGDDYCKTNYPHGIKYYPDPSGDVSLSKVYSADMFLNRVLEIPVDHSCYSDETLNPPSILATGLTPRAIAKTSGGDILVTKDVLPFAINTFPVFDSGDSGWQLQSHGLRLGAAYGFPGGAFPYDLDAYTVNGEDRVSVTSAYCYTTRGGPMLNSLPLTVWNKTDKASLVPLWTYPIHVNDSCNGVFQ